MRKFGPSPRRSRGVASTFKSIIPGPSSLYETDNNYIPPSVPAAQDRALRSTTELYRDLYRLNLITEPNFSEVHVDEEDKKRFLRNVPEGLQNLRMDLLKGCMARRYDIIPEPYVKMVLEESESVVPRLQIGTKAIVYLSHCEQGHSKFFLQLQCQEDRLFLINRWLTDRIEFRKLESVRGQNGDLKGKMVAAPLPDTIVNPYDDQDNNNRKGRRLFGRGFIKNVQSEAEIFFMDFGCQGFVSLNELWVVPPAVSELRPLCFIAHLVPVLTEITGESLAIAEENAATQFTTIANRCTPYWTQTRLECVVRFFRSSTTQRPASYGVQLEILSSREREKDQVHVPISALNELELSKSPKVQADQAQWGNGSLNNNRSPNAIALPGVPCSADKPPFIPINNTPDLLSKMMTQLHPDMMVDIKPYTENEYRHMRQFKVLNAISPGNIQLEYVSFDQKAGDWWRQMQANCDERKYRAMYAIRQNILSRNRCYVWKDQTTSSWNRVRIVEPSDNKSRESKAWAVDRGQFVQVKFEDLMEIAPTLCASPASAFKAHLVDLQPSPIGNNKAHWSSKSTDYFKSICPNGKMFYGLTLEMREEDKNDLNSISYGVVLADGSQNSGTVQACLANSKLVTPAGPCAGRHDLAYMLNEDPCYDRLKILGELKLLDIDEKKILKSKANKTLSILSRQDLQTKAIPIAMRSRMGGVWICCEGTGPGCFFVMMSNKVTEFEEMVIDLDKIAEKLPSADPKDVLPGRVFIAKALDSENTKNCYHRVVVLNLTDVYQNCANAACVDTGLEFLINLETVRVIPQNLKLIPPFCHRVHLDFSSSGNPLIPGGNGRWTKEANSIWRRFVASWNGYASYYAWQPNINIIELEEFNQELIFNNTSMTWEAGKLTKSDVYSAVNSDREQMFLKQFYKSIGISLVYEVIGQKFFEFVPISGHLETLGCMFRRNT